MRPTELSLRRVVRASPEKVFAAWTEPELLKLWWGPGPVTCPQAHVDLREGGAYRIANLDPDGSMTWITGRFERVVPPAELVYTWSIGTMMAETTLVTVRFLPHAEGTEIVLLHERFPLPDVRDKHVAGWQGCLDKLDLLLRRAG